MIKNERQYHLTRAQAEKFRKSLSAMESSDDPFAPVHRAAMHAQCEELEAEMLQYEALRSGRQRAFSVQSLQDLPVALIKARIAMGLTQRELAKRLGVREQQVQRWESEDYQNAGLDALRSVAETLNLETSAEFFLPCVEGRNVNLARRLTAAGVVQELRDRILPPSLIPAIEEDVSSRSFSSLFCAASILSRVLSIPVRKLLGAEPLPTPAYPGMRFKMSSRANQSKVGAYAVYAHYLAGVIVEACPITDASKLPLTWIGMREALMRDESTIRLKSVVSFAWECGVVIVPLVGSGAFHGAVWHIKGRTVIALKQSSEFSARWLFDLLHELGHEASGHVSETDAVIETEPIGPKEAEEDDDETTANEWAEDVLFGGKSEEIEMACVRECGGDLRKMKAAVVRVARTHQIDTAVLANHMAWRLAAQGENWWGAADNLQEDGFKPFNIVRDALLEHVKFSHLNGFDRELVMRAISDEK